MNRQHRYAQVSSMLIAQRSLFEWLVVDEVPGNWDLSAFYVAICMVLACLDTLECRGGFSKCCRYYGE